MWLTIIIPLLAVLLRRGPVDRVVLAGLIYQVSGLTMVWIGLRGLRRRYDPTGGMVARVRVWAREVPGVMRFPRPPVIKSVSASVSLSGSIGGTGTVTVLPPSWPLWPRLVALEKEVARLRDRHAAETDRLSRELERLQRDLAREGLARAADTQAVRDAVREQAVGVGFHFQFAGLLWLMLGVVIDTFPQDSVSIICGVLRSLGVHP